jgi:hypothetical protein
MPEFHQCAANFHGILATVGICSAPRNAADCTFAVLAVQGLQVHTVELIHIYSPNIRPSSEPHD